MIVTDIPAYILAGGRSRRFGSDKARAQIDGQPLIRRLAEALAPLVSRTTVVAQHDAQYADLGLYTIGDRQPHRGPLGGLCTAMHDARRIEAQWLFLVSCDLLEFKRHWLGQLLEARRPELDVVAFADQRWQPMPALYRVRLRERVDQHLQHNDTSLCRFIDAVESCALPLPVGWLPIAQANTPSELAWYRASRQSDVERVRQSAEGDSKASVGGSRCVRQRANQ